MGFTGCAIRNHGPNRELFVDSSRNRDAPARAQPSPTMAQLNHKPLIPIAWARAVAVGATAGAGGGGAGRVGGGGAAAGARAAGAGAGAAAARTCGATSARPAPADSKLIRN